jgi:hypothetical protein
MYTKDHKYVDFKCVDIPSMNLDHILVKAFFLRLRTIFKEAEYMTYTIRGIRRNLLEEGTIDMFGNTYFTHITSKKETIISVYKLEKDE